MTIKNIRKLKRFGIFQDHSSSGAKDFGRYNLFYGWNGSGKSTLSDVFRCIEGKRPSAKFPTSEFTIEVDASAAITGKGSGLAFSPSHHANRLRSEG